MQKTIGTMSGAALLALIFLLSHMNLLIRLTLESSLIMADMRLGIVHMTCTSVVLQEQILHFLHWVIKRLLWQEVLPVIDLALVM